MCKFYSGCGGVRGADSRINFPPTGLEITPRIRYKNLHQPLTASWYDKGTSFTKLKGHSLHFLKS